MDPTNLLLRIAMWVRHPPGRKQVWLMVAVLAISLALVGFEHVWGWPDWLKVNSGRMPWRMRP